MNLKIMIEQMIITGFHSDHITTDSDICKVLKNNRIGGVILFDYNSKKKNYKRNIHSPRQVKKLTSDLQKLSEIPLFIAIDQEGGKVCRLKKEKGFSAAASVYHIGKSNDSEYTAKWSSIIGQDLKASGINLNLAPVVDLAVNHGNPAISMMQRSFSDDYQTVVKHAGIFCEQMRNHKILSCIKHFPGQGSAENDTHLQFTDVTNCWNENELKPFEYLIAENKCDIVMTAHLFNKNIDDKFPATLSYNTIQKLLREKLNWNGAIISDDLQMKAIKDNFTLEETIYNAINAGIDILLFANNRTEDIEDFINEAVNTTMKLVNSKQISKNRIFNSYEKIIKLKKSVIS